MANTESYERLSTILNSVSDAVIATDNKGLITFMNPVAETLIGWEMEEVSGNLVEKSLLTITSHPSKTRKKIPPVSL